MSIQPRFLQDLRDRLTLSEVIGGRLKLTRAGREFKACCPFHSEKSASFYINDDKQFYHCFGCGAHGDVVGFVMRHDNLSFIEAIEQLATKAGMQVPRQTHQDVEQAKKDKSLYALCDDAAKYFEAQLRLPANHEILDYMRKRNLGDDTMASFRIGYAPADEQALRRHLKGLEYTDAQMLEAGVIRASSKGGDPYSFFRDRVMFPVMDVRGRVVAFGGRVLPEHIRPLRNPDNKPPKYINSSDTPLFHKGRMVYAQQHARMAANDHTIVVVEGYMDAIACHQAGFKGTVAPLGTALTEEQMLVLWKMIPHDRKEPVLCFDGDSAGYRAAVRAIDRVLPLLKPNQSVRFAFLPEGDDPDTFIQENGAEAFKELISTKAVSALDFIWTHHTAGQKFDTPETRAGLSALLDEIAVRIPDSQLQYHYKAAFREKTRALFQAAPTFSKQAASGFQKKGGLYQKGPPAPKVTLPPLSKKKSQSLTPQILLLSLINHPGIYGSVQDCVHQIEPDSPELQRLYDGMLDIFDSTGGEGLDREAVVSHLTSLGLADIVNRLANERLYIHAGFARPDADPEKVLEGWKSFWDQWDKSRLLDDIEAAKAALRTSFTSENQDRMIALQQIQLDKDTGTDG
jgi:DNA primase